ncbi:MAG TPA: ABC transporter, partial [Flavobacteriales bacterium]|nr:ABC transporter [Flavobacteriales bacterium]
LLKILTGKEDYDSGSVVYRKDLRVAFLEQSPYLDSSKSIMENLFESENEVTKAIKNYEMALQNPSDNEQLNKAIEEIERLKAWDYEQEFKQILSQLKIDNVNLPVNVLSGGQQKRVALAQILIRKPDFLILDEPTNHLDLEMIEWLEEYLQKTQMTLLMVTHDRYFLERVCNTIIELENQQIYKYEGNYSYYLQKKEERQQIEQATIDKAKNLYSKELEWMRRMPKARGTKSKSRIDRFYDIEKQAKKRLDEKQVEVEINMQRLGSKIVELHNAVKRFDDKLILDKFSYVFKRKDRIGIIGKNGVGKSTFLNILTGKEKLNGGKIIIGETVVFGYYNQSGMNFKPGQRVIEAIKDIAEVIPLTKGKKITASQLLERFLFPKSMHYNYIERLSGGEQKRLYLLNVLMKNPNFLILDEPTNDLDIITLNVLEDFLSDFPGCLLIVSHDRYFMDKLVEHVFVFEGEGKVRDFPGNYTQYRAWSLLQSKNEKAVKSEKNVIKEPANPNAISEKPKEKKKLSFKEKYEFEQLDKEIPQLEKQKEELESKLMQGNLSHEELTEISTQLGELTKELDDKTNRWIELSEFM